MCICKPRFLGTQAENNNIEVYRSGFLSDKKHCASSIYCSFNGKWRRRYTVTWQGEMQNKLIALLTVW